MRPGLAAREQRRACRLDRHELHIRIFLFEIASCAGECAARADASDEKIDAAVGIAPELGAGGEIVRLGVRGIVELCGMKLLGVAAASSSARFTAPAMPSAAGVSTSSAP